MKQEYEIRPNRKFNEQQRVGKGTVDVECPFCGEVTRCYVWSLAGSGKKCICGAIHSWCLGSRKKINQQ
jgi:hypothetical protein